MNGLRTVIASPLSSDLVELIQEREPRLHVVHRPDLLAPEPPDWLTVHVRTPEDQAEHDAMVDSAEVLFGVPDHSGAALARTVRANPRLRWVHTPPAGGGAQVRSARLPAEALQRIVFTTSAGAHAEPLAEFALFGVLAGAKQLPRLQADHRERRWASRRTLGHLVDSTVAVVGLGSIGRRTAEMLSSLGCNVVGVHRREVDAAVSRIAPVEQLDHVLAEADAVVLALPGTPLTEGMLNREVLARAKPGLTVVNVGRGSTIDESALAEALQDGRVGLAVLDVTSTEPLEPQSPLWDLENVVLSPHTAAVSKHVPRRVVEIFVENARRILDGEEPLNRVNTDEFY